MMYFTEFYSPDLCDKFSYSFRFFLYASGVKSIKVLVNYQSRPITLAINYLKSREITWLRSLINSLINIEKRYLLERLSIAFPEQLRDIQIFFTSHGIFETISHQVVNLYKRAVNVPLLAKKQCRTSTAFHPRYSLTKLIQSDKKIKIAGRTLSNYHLQSFLNSIYGANKTSTFISFSCMQEFLEEAHEPTPFYDLNLIKKMVEYFLNEATQKVMGTSRLFVPFMKKEDYNCEPKKVPRNWSNILSSTLSKSFLLSTSSQRFFVILSSTFFNVGSIAHHYLKSPEPTHKDFSVFDSSV